MATAHKKKHKPVDLSKALDVTVIVITVLLLLFGTIGLFSGIAWIYMEINPTVEPESHVTSYIGTIQDENNTQRYFIELEYWENKDGAGEEVFEFCFNAYSGVDCTTVIKKVAQFFKGEPTPPKFDSDYVNGTGIFGMPVTAATLTQALSQLQKHNSSLDSWTVNYYDKAGNTSWKSIRPIEVGTPMYVTINDNGTNKLFSVTMDGTYQTPRQTFNLFKSIGSIFRGLFSDAGSLIKKDSYYDTVYDTHKYTMNDFYTQCLISLTAADVGYGTTILSLVDLADFFTIKDGSSGQFEDIEDYQEYAKEYFAVKMTKHAEGMRRASESNAEMFDGKADWTSVETDNLFNDFANYEITTALTQFDFVYRYCEQLSGYVAVLKDEFNSPIYNGAIFSVCIDAYALGDCQQVVGILFESMHNYSTVDVSTPANTFYSLSSNGTTPVTNILLNGSDYECGVITL